MCQKTDLGIKLERTLTSECQFGKENLTEYIKRTSDINYPKLHFGKQIILYKSKLGMYPVNQFFKRTYYKK